MAEVTTFGSKEFFLSVVQESDLLGLSSGYEGGDFRNKGLADLMFAALPDFALSYSEGESLNKHNAMERLRRAVKTIYQSEKFKDKGEFGELLLHLVMRDYFGSLPAVSKIFYKDAPNGAVKGFDAVHVVPVGDDLQLWLGEAKFYNSVSGAIASVVKDLESHTSGDYLRNEFLLVTGKIDSEWAYADKLKKLIDPKTSLDAVFSKLVVPILLTYDSDVVKSHKESNDSYRMELDAELRRHHKTFTAKEIPSKLEFVLVLVPLHTKEILASTLHEKLKHLQAGL